MGSGIRAPLRMVGALAIALVFVSVLMTASAQQEVVRQLAAVDPKLGYSSACVIKRQVDQADQDARVAAANEQAANRAADEASDMLDAARSDFNDDWTAMLPRLRVLARSRRCGLDRSVPDPANDAQRGQIMAALNVCPAAAPILAAPAASGPATDYRRMLAAQQSVAQARQALARAQAVSGALSRQDAKAKDVRDSFDATSKLRSSWYLGGDLLIDFPPALLQIILSFVSGTFGALLLTLVLIVYPNNRFTMASDGGYGARTLLGGLIALCVYVVLNGGSAVLGSANPSGGGNYMTFCAIAILAGMFSDRVASWLSARADAFFKVAGNQTPRNTA